MAEPALELLQLTKMHIHGFPTLKNSYQRFDEGFTFLTWILKAVISILGNGREYITGTCVCRFHAFQDDHAVTGGEELQLKWVRDNTDPRANRFLVSFFASYFLISWQKPSRLFATCEIFQNFSWCQLSAEQKFSRENFCGLLKIRENRESFLTVKLLSFMVVSQSVGNSVQQVLKIFVIL